MSANQWGPYTFSRCIGNFDATSGYRVYAAQKADMYQEIADHAEKRFSATKVGGAWPGEKDDLNNFISKRLRMCNASQLTRWREKGRVSHTATDLNENHRFFLPPTNEKEPSARLSRKELVTVTSVAFKAHGQQHPHKDGALVAPFSSHYSDVNHEPKTAYASFHTITLGAATKQHRAVGPRPASTSDNVTGQFQNRYPQIPCHTIITTARSQLHLSWPSYLAPPSHHNAFTLRHIEPQLSLRVC
ncbi:hypothetical protein BDZ89DRAFT_1038920 [Hymenopellis radicata]|nr:hypothetical protein BDZ89DRAFT_1038920 [Hymenopellis radicata]